MGILAFLLGSLLFVGLHELLSYGVQRTDAVCWKDWPYGLSYCTFFAAGLYFFVSLLVLLDPPAAPTAMFSVLFFTGFAAVEALAQGGGMADVCGVQGVLDRCAAASASVGTSTAFLV